MTNWFHSNITGQDYSSEDVMKMEEEAFKAQFTENTKLKKDIEDAKSELLVVMKEYDEISSEVTQLKADAKKAIDNIYKEADLAAEDIAKECDATVNTTLKDITEKLTLAHEKLDKANAAYKDYTIHKYNSFYWPSIFNVLGLND